MDHNRSSLEKDTRFDAQFKQHNHISNEMLARARMQSSLPRSSVEEFRNNPRLNEQPWDIPDIIDLESAIRYLRDEAIKYLTEKEDEVNATSWRKSKA